MSQSLLLLANSHPGQPLWRGEGRSARAQELGPHPAVLGPVTFVTLVEVSTRVSVAELFSSSQRHLILSASGITLMILAGTNTRSVMFLAGIQLIFFTAAAIVLCFGLSMKTMLITHRWFGCCWVALVPVKDFSSFPCSAGGTRSREGRGHSQESRFKLTKGIFHVM